MKNPASKSELPNRKKRSSKTNCSTVWRLPSAFIRAARHDFNSPHGHRFVWQWCPVPVGPPTACFVAREVYGIHDIRWLQFREWLQVESPAWFRSLYIKHGKTIARLIADNPT